MPLITPKNWRMTELINQHFRNAGLQPTQTFEVGTNTAIQALVSTGLAAAIMPRLAVDPDLPDTRVVELDGLFPARTLVLYWHRERVYGPALETFVAAARTASRILTEASDAIAAAASVQRLPSPSVRMQSPAVAAPDVTATALAS